MHRLLIALLLAVVIRPAFAADAWVSMATISSTLGNSPTRVCIGGGATDIGCPAYAPEVGTDGSISATRFVGDGSGLTGVVASTADRIVSGSTSMVAVSSSGFVSLTQAGTNTGWFDPTRGLVTLGVSATGRISGTTGYFGDRVGIGLTTPTTALEVSGTISATEIRVGGISLTAPLSAGMQHTGPIMFRDTSGTMRYLNNSRFYVRGYGWNAEYPMINIGTNNTSVWAPLTVGTFFGHYGIYITGSDYEGSRMLRIDGNLPWSRMINLYSNGYIHVTRLNSNILTMTAEGNSQSRYTLSMNANNNSIGINTVTPTSHLEVSGTISATSIKASGTISATLFVGDGSGLTGVVASTADRIVSGSTSMVAVSSSGFVSLTQAGTNTGWFDPTRGLVTLGVSSTGRISGTSGYFANGLTVRGLIDIVTSATNVGVGGYAFANASGDAIAAFGYQTAQYNNGSNLTALGYQAAFRNSATSVVAIGNQAGRNNTGEALTAVGVFSAQYNSSTYSTAVGFSAARFSSGTMLTALGFSAATNNSGSYVTAVGGSSGQYNTGSNVEAVGYNAAISNTGSNVVAVGTLAARNNTYNNVVALGYNAQPDKANQIVLGDSNIVEVSTAGVIMASGVSTTGTVTATRFVGDGSGLTGLNASTDRLVSGSAALILSSTGVLSLNGRLELNSGTGVVGIGTEAAINSRGNYVAALGMNAARYNSGSSVNALGYVAAQDNRGDFVNALGYAAARMSTGSSVNAMGYAAAFGNTGGSVNAFGYSAAQYNSGSSVNALGVNAAQNNTGGNVNAFGYAAGQNNTGGHVNASGYAAGTYNIGSYVNAMGQQAAEYNSASHVNALGYLSGQYNTGSYVDAMGARAANSNTGSDVVAIGRYAAISNTFSNVVALGYNTQPDKANQIVLGNSSIVEVSTAGVILASGVSTTGTVTATRFVGDGSGLTGVVASTADRIVSGTTSMVAVSSSGFVSLTQAGTNTGWFDPTRGLVTLGVSATGAISGTAGYFSGPVGIGQTPTTHALSISGTLNLDGDNTLRLGHQYHYIRKNGTTNEYISSANHIFGGTWGNTLRLRNADAFFYGKTFIGDGASQPSTISSSLFVAGTTWITSWTIVNANTTPTAPLEVSGTVSATMVKVADVTSAPCGPENYGTIRYSNGKQYMCMPR